MKKKSTTGSKAKGKTKVNKLTQAQLKKLSGGLKNMNVDCVCNGTSS